MKNCSVRLQSHPLWNTTQNGPLLNHGLWVILIKQLVNGLHYPKLISVVRCIHNIVILYYTCAINRVDRSRTWLFFTVKPQLCFIWLVGQIYIYTHTYIHACMHAYMHTCIHPYMHTSIHPYIHTSIHPYIHTSIHPYIHPYIHTSIHPYIHTSIHPYIHTSIHPYIHTSIHPYIHTSIHPYIHTSIHPYIHTSIHPYIHTYIHIYIHTYNIFETLVYLHGHTFPFVTGRSPSSIDNFRQKHDQLPMMLMNDAMVAPMSDINSTRKPPQFAHTTS